MKKLENCDEPTYLINNTEIIKVNGYEYIKFIYNNIYYGKMNKIGVAEKLIY